MSKVSQVFEQVVKCATQCVRPPTKIVGLGVERFLDAGT